VIEWSLAWERSEDGSVFCVVDTGESVAMVLLLLYCDNWSDDGVEYVTSHEVGPPRTSVGRERRT